LLVAHGTADGVVAGALHPTRDIIRAALLAIGTADGVDAVSSAFYMLVPSSRGMDDEVLTLADAGVIPEPTADELADIGVVSARVRSLVVGDEPRVAYLSYSTLGSASGESVDRVVRAVEIFRERLPEVYVDGELQGDAALIDSVARRKAPGSSVAGRANVLVFPDLNSANIAYKLVQRITGGQALGPILQGLRRRYNDLSRGASADGILAVSCITALMVTRDE
jgi:phosphate acetyltransferase